MPVRPCSGKSTISTRSGSSSSPSAAVVVRRSDVSNEILSPPKDIKRRITSAGPVRRPNTAGLKDHQVPWSVEHLRGKVTRNGVGSATWRSALSELQQFEAQRADLRAEEDDDDDDDDVRLVETRFDLKKRPNTAGGGVNNNSAAVLVDELRITRLPSTHFSYAPLSKESVLLRTLRSISGLRDLVQSLPQDLSLSTSASTTAASSSLNPQSQRGGATHPSGGVVASSTSPSASKTLRQLRGLLQDADIIRHEQRGSTDLKVIFRSLFLERATSLYGRSTASTLLSFFQCFNSDVVVVPQFLLSLDYAERPAVSVRLLVEILCRALSYHQASVHIAELQAARWIVKHAAAESLQLSASSKGASTAAGAPHVAVGAAALLRRSSLLFRPSSAHVAGKAAAAAEDEEEAEAAQQQQQLDPVSVAFCSFVEQLILLLQPLGDPQQQKASARGSSSEGRTQEVMTWRSLRAHMLNVPLLCEFLM